MEYALGVDLGTTHIAAAVHHGGRLEMVPVDSPQQERSRALRQVVDAVTTQRGRPPGRIVVTHPAHWGPDRRARFGEMVEAAGLSGVVTLTDPEAAAARHAASHPVDPGDLIAVYDLGGATFDAAVLRRTGTGYEMPGSPAGIERLGGRDFDEAVLGHVTRALGETPADLDAVRHDCAAAKEALSTAAEAHVPVGERRVRITRTEFEALVTPALGDTVEALGRAIRAAGVTAADLRVVLLGGGSSRIPLVAQLIGAAYGRPVLLDPHPADSIAMGAALVASMGLQRPRLPRATVRARARTADSTVEIAPGPPVAEPDPLARQRRRAIVAAVVIVLAGAIIGVALALRATSGL